MRHVGNKADYDPCETFAKFFVRGFLCRNSLCGIENCTELRIARNCKLHGRRRRGDEEFHGLRAEFKNFDGMSGKERGVFCTHVLFKQTSVPMTSPQISCAKKETRKSRRSSGIPCKLCSASGLGTLTLIVIDTGSREGLACVNSRVPLFPRGAYT